MKISINVGNMAGEICKMLIPIHEEVYFGNQKSSIAICTLSDIDLLKKISNSKLMEEIFVVGRLLSENKGIDEIIRFVSRNNNVKTIVLCGSDVMGHKPGMALLELYENGVDANGRIINSKSRRIADSKITLNEKNDVV